MTTVLLFPLRSRGAALTPQEQAFFKQHLSDIVKIEPTRLSDPAIEQVFKAPLYDVKVEIIEGSSTEESHLIVARVDQDLVQMSSPGTTEDLPQVQKLIDPQFKLQSEQDAKKLEKAIDAIDPISTFGDDAKAKAIKHEGNQWLLIRGEFFKKHKGYVFTTDKDGHITALKYSLELP
jgi:hypothetical protein